MGKEAISAANNGIIRLLVSYAKPTVLLSSANSSHLNSDLIEMLKSVCRYFNLCCLVSPDCVSLFVEGGGGNFERQPCNLISDLVECLALTSSRHKQQHKSSNSLQNLASFHASIFELLTTFLTANEDKRVADKCIFKITRFWSALSTYLADELLELDLDCTLNINNNNTSNEQLMNVGIKFFAVYFGRLTQLISPSSTSTASKLDIVRENVCLLFDSTNYSNGDSFGSRLCSKLIKIFDKYFLVDSNSTMKVLIFLCFILVLFKI